VEREQPHRSTPEHPQVHARHPHSWVTLPPFTRGQTHVLCWVCRGHVSIMSP
jgi:hypothetical protein